MNPDISFSFDDAGKDKDDNDNARLANLLRKYDFKNVTFYVIPFNKDIIRLLAQDFKIGSHTMTHPILRDISSHQAKWEIEESKKILEKITKRKVKSFCYPRGRFNRDVKKLVENAGYREARTTRIGCIKKPKDRLETDTSAHICPIRPEYRGTTWLKEAKKLLDRVLAGEGDYFHLWGHAYEIEKFEIWDEFEEFLQYINKRL